MKRNESLEEGIVLSGEQATVFLKSLFKPDKEYLNKRDDIFAKMDKEISIIRNGSDIEVDISGFDLDITRY